MFQRFRQDARRAVARAREEAAAAGQGEIGCEHLLLGLRAEPGPAAAAMTAAGLELTALRSRLPRPAGPSRMRWTRTRSRWSASTWTRSGGQPKPHSGRAPSTGPERARPRRPGRMRLTAEAKKALELALHATIELRHRELTGGHLMIGIIDQGHNGALDLLSAFAASPAALRADVITRLAEAA